MAVAFLVAFAEFFFRLAQTISAPFYALFLVGPAAMLYEIYRSPPGGAGDATHPTSPN